VRENAKLGARRVRGGPPCAEGGETAEQRDRASTRGETTRQTVKAIGVHETLLTVQ
jgi:hypothetical protein